MTCEACSRAEAMGLKPALCAVHFAAYRDNEGKRKMLAALRSIPETRDLGEKEAGAVYEAYTAP